jgi:hypothetical protein
VTLTLAIGDNKIMSLIIIIIIIGSFPWIREGGFSASSRGDGRDWSPKSKSKEKPIVPIGYS